MTLPTRTRLTPEQRRAQLLDLGVRLLATRSLEELSIDVLAEEAGISRGLLYHYFGNKHDFHRAVVRHAADDLIAQTSPPVDGDPLRRLAVSIAAYVDYVDANYEGYLSLVKGAAGGDEHLREIYDEVRAALTDRVFRTDAEGVLVPDTPATRVLVNGWAALAEEVALLWKADPASALSRDQVVVLISDALPALIATVVELPFPAGSVAGLVEGGV
ncbi:TetR/AcrR family transcriptional regulator [Nocardioides sp. TRM66260-LWL]|uniref:TetR/AcrR family transcriptional regulator n=1 Tax=Nocardioides sp. TRM66260-LWL TaxID=2874478 RepID=UPI001CC7F67F|nr:TetR/AcrR family transcriptional regulator [Nocardioides sp. TRM66260-LWL]MBZ5734442.1 TetR/AcrR family transcriptional regulator [Nocardioides sp. TRM66260-LWL]